MSLPGADELFRTTGGTALQPSSPRQHANGETPGSAPRVPAPAGEQDPAAKSGPGAKSGSGAKPGPGGKGGPGPAAPSAPSGEGASASGTGSKPGAPGEAAPAEHSGRESDDGKSAEVRTPPQAARSKGRAAQEGPGAPRPATGANPSTSAQAAGGQAQARRRSRNAPRRPSGRERHDEKITVYVSAEELMDLEHARLVLRGEHGLAVDRGRIVREAVAVVLADLESRGDASILVRRLRGR
ncbi:hypothetical protein [Streptomyces sp. 7N604]|uniref:hypothetical protein n=1 Tax=Streptomyces sp. 7N604 TaxID=3457415 RepID=UPI003FD5DC6C